MPAVHREGPYRFFFDSEDRDEPDDCVAKIWLDPVRLERSEGFSPKEVNHILAIIERIQRTLLDSWNEFFGN